MKCRICSTDFDLFSQEKEFYQKNDIPFPVQCFKCRDMQRLAFWPFGNFRKRKCDFSGETIVTTFPENSRFPVYKKEHWFTDKWEVPTQEIDLEKPFFNQLYELQSKVPHYHTLGRNAVNCDYTDDCWECKNCYLCRSMSDDEDSYYCYRFVGCKDSMDLTYCYYLERCYECIFCFKGFNLRFCFDCQECSDSLFLYDCRGCKNCFGCYNLRNKQYFIYNKPYSKDEYEKKLREFNLESRAELLKLRENFEEIVENQAIHKLNFNKNTENSTGDFLTNCKNCQGSFFLEDSEDSYFAFRGLKHKNCVDATGLYNGEVTFGTCQVTDLYNVKMAVYCVNCKDCEYIDQCYNCKNCFGCVGLKNREYCILNKQYSKEEYIELAERLREKMKMEKSYGLFFPYRFAYQGFNMSLAPFYFHKSKEEIESLGGYFEDYDPPYKEGTSAETLPDSAKEVSGSFSGKPYIGKTGKEYLFFIKQEIDFYKKMGLPFPVAAYEERNRLRFQKLGNVNFSARKCSNCNIEIQTIYSPDSPKLVYCQQCYLKAVY